MGLSADDVNYIRRRWYHMSESKINGSFDSFDKLLDWSKKNTYEPGMKLKRHDTKKPHSPENSFWEPAETGTRAHRRPKELQPSKMDCSPDLCKQCQEKCEEENGCEIWRQHFVHRWNMLRELFGVRKTDGKIFFRYEHPDLVREGKRWK